LVYGLWDKLFVESCPACGGASEGGFCAVCAADFARVRDACPRCGLAQPVSQCPRTHSVWDVDAVLAPFSYGPPLDHYVQALKYRGARTLGRALALLLLPAARAWLADVDALIAVPLHRKRRRERGYNQAQEIARTLGSALRLPTLERGIERHAFTPTQTGQSADERRTSVAHAFRVARDFAGQRVAIVDDVVTTGATVNALAAELRAAGAAYCIVLAVARTPLGSPRRGAPLRSPRRGTPAPAQTRNV
jgi:ComF family protein